MFDCTETDDPVHFTGPTGVEDVHIGLGTTVVFEYAPWLSAGCVAHIVSTVTPRGGTPFDSGDRFPEGRFDFRPDVPGKWEFKDTYSGGTGQVTVAPPASARRGMGWKRP